MLSSPAILGRQSLGPVFGSVLNVLDRPQKFRSCRSRSPRNASRCAQTRRAVWSRTGKDRMNGGWRRFAPRAGADHGVDRGERRSRGREQRTAATSCARSQRFIATRRAISSPDAAPPRPYSL